MPYSSNKTINGLEAETTIADSDELVFGDVSDTNRAKKITFANFKTEVTGDDTAFVRKADYNANTILQATTNDTPVAITISEQTVVGRATGGNITALAIDSDLSSVSSNDDTVPSAKATKTALDLKANDSAVVKLTGDQTIAGVKTFSSDPIIPDEAYGSGWNGVLEPPTKNAVYDKIESLSVTAKAIIFRGDSGTGSSGNIRYGRVGGSENTLVGSGSEPNGTIVPFSGTVKNLYVKQSVASATSDVYVIRKNGVDTTLTVTFNNETTTKSDTTHTFSVSAGDRLTFSLTSTGAGNPVVEEMSVEIDPT